MKRVSRSAVSRCRSLSSFGFLVALATLLGSSLASVRAESFKVVINEVHYHPADDQNSSEFVEFHNFDDSDADLGGWVLTGGVTFVFPPGARIPPGGFVVVANSEAGLVARYGLDESLILGEFTGDLENEGEKLALFTRGGFLASSIEYSDSEPWPETPDGLGPSLERRSPVLDDADPEAFEASVFIGGTPGEINSRAVEDDGLPVESTPITLIPAGADWRYRRGDSAPPADWNQPGFDDAKWPEAPAGFGYDRGDFETPIDDMQSNYSTFFIRHRFDVSAIERVEALNLNVIFDDGFVAYLNGVEVARANISTPAGEPVPHDAFAFPTTRIAETRDYDLAAFRELLVPEGNLLALQGINGSIDSRDFTLHPSLAGTLSLGETRNERLVRPNDDWRFLRGSGDIPEDWASPDFDDAAWETGPGGFGFGDDDDATVLDDMAQTYLTVYIRRSFDVDLGDVEGVLDLVLDVDYDDGFVAYLNGVEIARSNVGGVGPEDPAIGSHEAGLPETFTVPASALRDGENTLALQGHNTGLESSDFSLAAGLDARFLINDKGGKNPEPVDLGPAPRDLVINEVFPGAEASGWVELFNPGAAEVDVSGRLLLLEPAGRGRYEIPAGSLVPAGGFLRIQESDLGFELESISALLLATDGLRFIDALNPRLTADGQSSGRFPDGATSRFVFAEPTPSASNDIDLEFAVVINEILYHPSSDRPDTEYVELHNRTSKPINLGGWSFTRGVSFDFPDGTEIDGDGFLVIAASPGAVQEAYGIDGVLGPWVGGLDNDAETILLRNRLRNPVDRVRFADEGSWPEEADGDGPSVELIHPDLVNRYGTAWRASDGPGTPGLPNSRLVSNPGPIIVGISHQPVIPSPTEPVRVLATISDDDEISTAQLRFQTDGGGGDPQSVVLVDDGVGDDGIPGNGVFGAEIPPYGVGVIVRFWIHAETSDGQEADGPAGAPERTCLYQVEMPRPESARPVFRVVMRGRDLSSLRSRGNGSDNLLDVTVIEAGKAFYNRGLRYRGSSARSCNPLSYRVQFDHDRSLFGKKRVNINGCNVQRQWIGLDFLSRTGIPTPFGRLRLLSLNGAVDDRIYIWVEAIDDQFLERTLPGDDDGNLYRGIGQANLDYRGDNFDRYRNNYDKRSNQSLDDYSDLVDLCSRFDPDLTPDDEFPQTLEEKVDVDQWSLYFAAYAVLGSTENSIVLNNGDDYFLYHRFSDDLWILLPWDLDSCFDDSRQNLFRPTVDAIVRFLRHPQYAPDYWCFLEDFLETAFVEEQVNARIDVIESVFPPGTISQLRNYVSARREFILARISDALTVDIEEGGTSCGGALIASSPSLSLRGSAPTCGTFRIEVNGTPASYDRTTSEWTADVDLGKAAMITVDTIDRRDEITHRLRVPVVRSDTQDSIPDVVAKDFTLEVGAGVFVIDSTVEVRPGATLRIPAGVSLFFAPDAKLSVAGTLIIDGSDDSLVTLRGRDCDEPWPGIEFRAGSTGNRIRNAEILDGGSQAKEAAVVVGDAEVSLEGLLISRPVGVGLAGEAGSRITMLDCELRGGSVGVNLVESITIVRGCRFVRHREIALASIGNPQDSLEMSDCVIFDSPLGISLAGAIDVSIDHTTIDNCPQGIDVNTLPTDLGGRVALIDSSIVSRSANPIEASPTAELEVTFTNTEGAAMLGEGNISLDPLFVDADGEDFRLLRTSPCIGTGRDDTDMGAIPFDNPSPPVRFLLCDSNGDGTNNLTDAVYTLRHLFAQDAPPICLAAGDCDSNGELNLTDAIFDLNHLFNQGPLPMAPYPSCASAPADECLVETCQG